MSAEDTTGKELFQRPWIVALKVRAAAELTLLCASDKETKGMEAADGRRLKTLAAYSIRDHKHRLAQNSLDSSGNIRNMECV
jgi:hypothetical protein